MIRIFLLLAPVLAHATPAIDPCVHHCTIEPDADGVVTVLCACNEKRSKAGDDIFALRQRAPGKFQLELTKRLRGATEAELALVRENACAQADNTEPLCRCVRDQAHYPAKKRCAATGAGEVACEFDPGKEPLDSPRAVNLRDYQECIAGRMNYQHDSCYDGYCSVFPDAYYGGLDVKREKIHLDPEFTKKERGTVEAALAAMPACWLRFFYGLKIRKSRLMWKQGKVNVKGKTFDFFECEGGEAHWANNLVTLDPYCMGSPAVVLHELFHILEGRASLYPYWEKVQLEHPKCPVSSYGATNAHEDFAETGRLLMYPKDDGITEPKYRKPCVDEKIAAFRKIVDICP